MTTKELIADEACALRHVRVRLADLPLSCPPRDKRVWDVHPRVYLSIEATGQVTCPYCSTQYTLEE